MTDTEACLLTIPNHTRWNEGIVAGQGRGSFKLPWVTSTLPFIDGEPCTGKKPRLRLVINSNATGSLGW
jgi:hypothetical protein